MWSYLFGAGAANKNKDAPKKAILDLREHITLLGKKEAHLQTQVTTQEQAARQLLGKNNKVGAKNALKRKKTYESQLLKIQAQMDSLEQQLHSIESANLNLETMKAMKQGASAMKNIHKGMDIDKVDETMDEIREQVELGEEISDAISRPLHAGAEVDEDEIDEELEALAAENVKQEVVPPQRLPSVPQDKVFEWDRPQEATRTEEEEEEEDEDERALRELQAEMGL
ncbi:LANO_0D07690g1_1 [Lachancea nothofagi CBS 11611]|uniref:Vacuolar-sorting protein SNF7 n=1 Tax=Lachancea nothofagi CBS 11611 TaxID=1266666 RepID=A0A1G4JI97_9SACH|nr:LANO_0D07690g1_1 [Lachancea nothofagi CBS 11611]